MSSRALRKLRREAEEQKQLETQQSESDSEPGLEKSPAKPKFNKVNAFDFLNEAPADSESEEEIKTQGALESTTETRDEDEHEDQITHSEDTATLSQQTSKKPKKKSKKKKKKLATRHDEENTATPSTGVRSKDANLDEIDLALRALKTNGGGKDHSDEATGSLDDLLQFYKLLATDTKQLNALNEMKKLFGDMILDEEGAGEAANPRNRRGQRQQLDLGAALAAGNSPASRGRNIKASTLRRNIFMQAKEAWPPGTSGGLSMEVVEKASDFTTEYRFVHSSVYQETQRQFNMCVESMDPQRIILHLRNNPYHVSSLLQVAEIAKQQGDHSVAGDLLERALFTLGRSVHSTFNTAVGDGKARFDFRRPENREFWLTCWRYIRHLGQRGTWRTSFEWAKLLLSLVPEGDPYCMRLLIDQLALRGGQSQHLLDLASTDATVIDWGQALPNVQISLALARYKLKQSQESRKALDAAASDYPWIFARLFQELNIDHVPKAIWGTMPRTDREKLETEVYVTRAKDLWNTPETVSFLVEVIESLPKASPRPPSTQEISLDEARHVVLSETPALISYLPRELTTIPTTSSDPFIPPDNKPSYDATPSAPTGLHGDFDEFEDEALFEEAPITREQVEQLANASENPTPAVASFLQSMLSRFGIGARNTTQPDDASTSSEPEPDEDLADRPGAIPGGRPEDDWPPHVMEGLARIRARSGRSDAPSPPSATDTTAHAHAATVADDDEAPPSEPLYDDQANQRWLAGRGLLALKDFITAHGTDERAWSGVDDAPAMEYAERIMKLEKKASRNFILDYALQQGTNSEVVDMVKRLVRREGGTV